MHAIVVCINYADYLADTLPKNRAYFQEYVIVTEEKDTATIELGTKHDCTLLYTNDRTKDGATFNKSGMIHAAQQMLHKKYPADWIAIMDADIALNSNMSTLDVSKLNKSMIYGISRNVFGDKAAFEAGRTGKPRFEGVIGFFQLYYDKSKFYPKWSKDCSSCDNKFRNDFRAKDIIKTVTCAHFGPICVNWKGRKSKKWS